MNEEFLTAVANVAETGLALVKSVRVLSAHMQPRVGPQHQAEVDGLAAALTEHEEKLHAAVTQINRYR